MKILIIALDGVPFEFVANNMDELQFISNLIDDSTWGTLRSIDPPITVPAWSCMLTGLDPGQLGIYGFRHLKRGSYHDGYIVTSSHLDKTYPWEDMGLKSIVIGLPPGYPARNYGIWVSDFLTPSTGKYWVYPDRMAQKISGLANGYIFDIEYRTDRKSEAFKELVEMTEKRWKVAEYLISEHPWDVFVLHEIGTDRLHHLFQKFFDPNHALYEPGNPYEDFAITYYKLIDSLMERLVNKARRSGELSILILSDHGNQAQRGVYAINMWLLDNGYLALNSEPERGCDVEKADIDWHRTQAWAWGGYYSRIFINMEGREPEGIVKKEEYEDLVREIKRKIKVIKSPWGHIANTVYSPNEIYRQVKGDVPDLMVYMDDVRVRPVQTMGYDSPWLPENDRGPDDSLHSFNGLYIAYPGEGGKRDMYAIDVSNMVKEIIKPGSLRFFP